MWPEKPDDCWIFEKCDQNSAFVFYQSKKGFFLRKQGIKWPSNDFRRTPNSDLKRR